LLILLSNGADPRGGNRDQYEKEVSRKWLDITTGKYYYIYGCKTEEGNMKDNHKYRVSVYLGKELYSQIEQMAKALNIPVATTTKLLLNTGFELSKTLEPTLKKSLEKGEQDGK
jgi:hypothetical protein